MALILVRPLSLLMLMAEIRCSPSHSCSSATPGVYSISATGSVNGIQISDQLLTTYTLKGTKVTITFALTVTTTTTMHAKRYTVHK